MLLHTLFSKQLVETKELYIRYDRERRGEEKDYKFYPYHIWPILTGFHVCFWSALFIGRKGDNIRISDLLELL